MRFAENIFDLKPCLGSVYLASTAVEERAGDRRRVSIDPLSLTFSMDPERRAADRPVPERFLQHAEAVLGAPMTQFMAPMLVKIEGRLSPDRHFAVCKLLLHMQQKFACHGSWVACVIQESFSLSMNRKVGQASRLPASAKPTRRSRWRARWAGETPALLCWSRRFIAPMRVHSWTSKLPMNRPLAERPLTPPGCTHA